ncbi:uncharacterized protein TNCV_269081 [Trichonephila clavipes]|nr:uncharacterized protein TNCV_269081 [Trichonephila clavipes]
MLVNYVPSLLHIASVKVATAIYMGREIQEFEKNPQIRSFFNTHGEKWEPFVSLKVSQCALPVELQEKIVALMRPLSFELNTWFLDHIQFFQNQRYDIYIVWNSYGMIDRLKTIERCIFTNCVPIDYRIHLACQYKIWTGIMELFEEAPWYDEVTKKKISHEVLSIYSSNLYPDLVRNMRCLIIERKFPNHPPEWPVVRNFPRIQRLVKRDREFGAWIFTEWLLGKDFLTDDDRVCFFNLDVGEQEELLKEIPFHMLMLLLQWPLQTQFLEVVDRLWTCITKEEFFKLLLLIHSKIEKGWRDFDYIDLMKTFWSRSPRHFQNYVQVKDISEQEEYSMEDFDIINNFLEKHIG